jgi:hypothetical protein
MHQISLVHLRLFMLLYTMVVHPLLRLYIIRINLLLLRVLIRSIRRILCRIIRKVLLGGAAGDFKSHAEVYYISAAKVLSGVPSIYDGLPLSLSSIPSYTNPAIRLSLLLSQSDTYHRQLVDALDSMFFLDWSI